ncbi:MAG: hypothetical protein ACRDRN_16940 [Sciscionella sp.]
MLIGDAVLAVAPHLGQGATQAIEDGPCSPSACVPSPISTKRSLGTPNVVTTGEHDLDHAGLTQQVLEAMVRPI